MHTYYDMLNYVISYYHIILYNVTLCYVTLYYSTSWYARFCYAIQREGGAARPVEDLRRLHGRQGGAVPPARLHEGGGLSDIA